MAISQCSGTSPNHSTPEGFQLDAGVQAPRDGLVDQCLPLLLQQGDEPLLARDVALYLLVGVVEEPDDGGLFFWRRHREWNREECLVGQLKS